MTLTETKIKTISLKEVAELADLEINQEMYSQTGIFIRRDVSVNDFRDAIKSVEKDIFRLKEVRIFFLKKGDVKYLLNFEEYEIKTGSLVILPPNCGLLADLLLFYKLFKLFFVFFVFANYFNFMNFICFSFHLS